MQRRRYLGLVGGVGAGVTAGCLGGGPSPADDPWNSDVTETESGRTALTSLFELESGTYASRTYAPDGRFEFSYDFSVEDGGPIDFYVVTAPEFDRYRDGDDFSHVTALSSEGTTAGSGSARRDAGEYVAIIDNTDVGEAAGENGVSGGIQLEVNVL